MTTLDATARSGTRSGNGIHPITFPACALPRVWRKRRGGYSRGIAKASSTLSRPRQPRWDPDAKRAEVVAVMGSGHGYFEDSAPAIVREYENEFDSS